MTTGSIKAWAVFCSRDEAFFAGTLLVAFALFVCFAGETFELAVAFYASKTGFALAGLFTGSGFNTPYTTTSTDTAKLFFAIRGVEAAIANGAKFFLATGKRKSEE